MFHSFFSSQARSKYLSFFSHSFSFILWSAEIAKSTILQVLFFFFFFCWLLLGLVFWPRLGDPCVCQSPIWVYASFSWTGAGLFMWSNLNFLHISQSIPLPTQSCFILLLCCVHLLCDWWFHHCHRIAYICYFVASYQLLLSSFYMIDGVTVEEAEQSSENFFLEWIYANSKTLSKYICDNKVWKKLVVKCSIL